ncbi:heat shock 70 kDa protein 17-like isoform X2 [Mangifera indica]|uniref:heat shock 70 kDa protein 17-like isoform X2 n=1 Tax=Mangifera indica TaxID=29780 RepID=UPI001CFAC695|nr:heat shock 70 kDa protein 17-like isoform X2 [Mangifera indica]
MLIRLVILLLAFSLLSVPSQSAVSSIDLGSEWLKVAVVNLIPGQSPISIAINEMSKRKSPALVSFHADTRLLGEEAAGIIARYPHKVYSQLRDMIGKPYKHVKQLINILYLPFQIVEDSRGGVSFKVDDGENDGKFYSVEELLAMIFSYAVNLAEFHSKVFVKDSVITVPPYFGQVERKGLLQAAELAGINVLALVNEHSGAALQYGIDKDFSNGSRHVIFYDMGATTTHASLVYFSAYNAKEFGKTVSVNQFQVKDVRWDPELGGQNMELRLVEYFADEFNKQVGDGVDVRKSPKAMAKLKKQVKRTKEILSANTAAPISVESLYDDRDFRSTITREKFEELCEDLWEKSLIPLKEVLTQSGLKVDEIYAVELIGGATRVPKLQAKLQEYLGRTEPDRHLDADEAIVLGASLLAANLSDGIKLNRKLGMLDGSSYGFVVELDGPDLVKDDSTRQLLVQRMKKLPSKMFRSIIHNKDFEVSLAYESDDLLPPGVTSPVFAKYDVSGLTDTSEKYSSRNLSSPIKANLHFSLSRSGILSLYRADAVIEITEWVEVPKKNLTVKNATSSSPNISLETGAGNSSEGGNENLHSDGGNINSSNSTVEEPNIIDQPTEKKLKKRTFWIPLKIVEKTAGPGVSLSKKALAECKAKLEALDKKDAERRRTAELKNNLESYIYATKEKLETAEFEKISTSEERETFIVKLDEVQDWLYMDGEDAIAKEFQERLDSLKALGDPIFFRFKELTARSAAVEYAKKYLGEVQQIVHDWEKNKPWLPKDRVDEVLKDADKFNSWLDEKENEQKETSEFSKPAFTSQEVYAKIFNLQDKVSSIKRIPNPKPKVEKKLVKNETESSGEGRKDSDSTSEDKTSQTGRPPSDSGSTYEEKTSQTKKSTAESDGSSNNNKVDTDAEPHEEL